MVLPSSFLHRSWHVGISLAYLPAWIIVALIWHHQIFTETNGGLVLVVHLLLGSSLASWSLFVAAPFGKSPQLAAVVSTFLAILFAIVAQVFSHAGTGVATIFTLIFPPGYYIFAIRAICGFENRLMPANLLKPDPDDNLTLLPIMIACIVSIFSSLLHPFLTNMPRLIYFCGHIWEHYLSGVSTMQRSHQTAFGHVSAGGSRMNPLRTPTEWLSLSRTLVRLSLPPCSAVRKDRSLLFPIFRWTSQGLVSLSYWVLMGECILKRLTVVLMTQSQCWKVDFAIYRCEPHRT